MPRRYLDAVSDVRAHLGVGLRSALADGYTRKDLRADVLAGLAVGVVALPLSMALAIATGSQIAPQHGLYSAIVGGFVCALLGGTRLQVSGPSAALAVLLFPVARDHGLPGVLLCGLLAGFLQLVMGGMKLGRLISFIPHPVTTGLTTGMAVIIATLQLKDLGGLSFDSPATYVQRWQRMWEARGTFAWPELVVGVVTLAILVAWPKITKRLPAPLVGLVVMSGVVILAHRLWPAFHVETIGSRFQGIPSLPPTPIAPALRWELIQAVMPTALAVAMLGAIESLLAAVVADGMTGHKHDADAELVALGIGNVLCALFGGIAASGALARTVTNIQAGARSPIAAAVHSIFILLCTVALGGLMSFLPMAAMAGLLLLVAKNMSELRHFVHIVRVAPRSDVVVLLACFFLTVIFDKRLGVSVGIVLAALLFMRRMAELTDVKLDVGTMAKLEMPDRVLLYEIAGPLFFGAAQRAISSLETISSKRRLVVILYLGQVPAIDGTGLVALETMLARLWRNGHKVILAGLRPQPKEVIDRALRRDPGRLAFAPELETAVSMAIIHLARLDAMKPAPRPDASGATPLNPAA